MRQSYRITLLVLLCIALGFGLSNIVSTPPATAQQDGPTERHSFQVSAFGGNAAESARFGAYVIDTMTGKVWLIREGGDATPIGGTQR